MVKKSMLVWLLFVPLAILNGALREGVIEPWLGAKYANPISVLILCILVLIVSYIFIPRLGRGSNRTYITIGVLWVFATVIFETVLGLLMGITINEIIDAYNITTGNLWLIVVIFIGIVPLLIAKIKRFILIGI